VPFREPFGIGGHEQILVEAGVFEADFAFAALE